MAKIEYLYGQGVGVQTLKPDGDDLKGLRVKSLIPRSLKIETVILNLHVLP